MPLGVDASRCFALDSTLIARPRQYIGFPTMDQLAGLSDIIDIDFGSLTRHRVNHPGVSVHNNVAPSCRGNTDYPSWSGTSRDRTLHPCSWSSWNCDRGGIGAYAFVQHQTVAGERGVDGG